MTPQMIGDTIDGFLLDLARANFAQAINDGRLADAAAALDVAMALINGDVMTDAALPRKSETEGES